MKKYTIVYANVFRIGGHTNYITSFDRVETDDLSKTLKQDKYNGNTCFVFEGWPKQEEE